MNRKLFCLFCIWTIPICSAFAADITNNQEVTSPITMKTEDVNYTNASEGSIIINSAGNSIQFSDGFESNFINWGDVNITSTGDRGIDFGNVSNSLRNESTGTIIIDSKNGGIWIRSDSADELTNAGSLTVTSNSEGQSAISFGDGNSTLTNTGTIDVTSNDTETSSGSLFGYRGIDLGDGNNTFINDSSGTVTVTSSLDGVVFHGDDDTFTNAGNVTIDAIDGTGLFTSWGDDTFTNSGTMTIINRTWRFALGALMFSLHDDIFVNTGTLDISSTHYTGIQFGSGNNSFTNEAGATITIDANESSIDFRDFNADIQHLQNRPYLKDFNSSRADIFINAGELNLKSNFGEGIYLGSGNDILTNSGYITITSNSSSKPAISFDEGDDVFTHEGGSMTISSPAYGVAVDMGLGDDTFNFKAAIDSTASVKGGNDTDTLNLGGSSAFLFAGDIDGFETINKNDANSWELTGTITDSTAININNGMLYLNETVPGEVKVASSGSLGVTSPNSIGTLTLNGDFTQGTGTLSIDVDDTGADLLTVTGTADITDVTLLINPLADNLDVNMSRHILTAGTLNGEFATVKSTNPMLLFTPNYDIKNQVWLKETIAPLDVVGCCFDALMAAGQGNRIRDAIFSLSSMEKVKRAMDTISPEPIASAISASQNNVSAQYLNVSERIGIHHNPELLRQSKSTARLTEDYYPILNANGASAQALNAFWVKTIYLTTQNDSDDGKFEFETDTAGVSIGRDYLFDNFMVGVAGGYSASDIEFNTVPTDGDIDTLNLSLYGNYFANKYYIDAIISYSNHSYEMDRYIPVLDETANGKYRADDYSLYLRGGYPIKFANNLTVTPIASLQYSYYDQKAYTERGSDAALSVESINSDSFVSGLGVSVEKTLDYGSWKFLPHAKLKWKHEFGESVKTVKARITGFDSSVTTCVAQGYNPGDDSVALTIGGTVYQGGSNALFFNYDLEVKEAYESHAVTAGLKFYF